MAFDYYADFRSAATVAIRSDSWMGAETSGTTFNGEVRVMPGAALTLWQGTDITFAAGLVVEPGGVLVIEDDVLVTIGDEEILGGSGAHITIAAGALVRMGEGSVVRSASLITTGSAANPVVFQRSGTQAWSGIELVGQLWEGPYGAEGGHHLAHTRISGADLAVDVKAELASLSYVELVDNGIGVMSDYFMNCEGVVCDPSPSTVSLHGALVEGSVGHGLYIRNAEAHLGESTISRNGGYGVYAQNVVFMSFFENVITGNGDPNPQSQVMEGLRVANNGEVDTGRRGDTWGWPGLNRFDDNVREVAYLSGGVLFMGEDFDPYDPVGHYNTIVSSSTGCWILNNSGTTLLAEFNYWGDESGPPGNAFCGTSGVSYEPVHEQDETDGSGGGYRLLAGGGMLAAADASVGESYRSGGDPIAALRDRIRAVRGQLAADPGAAQAAGRVQRLAALHRQDRADLTGEWAASRQLLGEFRELLLDQNPGNLATPLRRAAERAAVVLAQRALSDRDFEAADALLAAYEGIVEGPFERLVLRLSAINIDEAFGRYGQALARIDALLLEIGEDGSGLAGDLAFLAGVIAAKREASGESGRGLPTTEPPISAAEDASLPDAFAFRAAFPNPTGHGATFPLALPEAAHVTVSAFDVIGRRVALLVDDRLDAGHHRARFDGSSLAAGVYVVRAEIVGEAGSRRVFTQRVTVVR